MEAAAEPVAPMPPGQQLAAERERQGLSRVEMAQRLHMSPSQVEALETGEYSRLPKGPFLRGFVRNYAKALGLNADEMLEQLAHVSPAESAPRIVVPSQNIRFDPLGERLSNPYVKAAGLALVVIALGFAAMYWWLFILPTPPAAHKPGTEGAQAVAPATPPPAESTVPAAAPSLQATAPTPAAENGGAKTEASPASAAPANAAAPKGDAAKAAEAAKPAAAPAPAPGESVLRFAFKGESWTEVRDANDKVLFQRLNPAGSEATVTGRPPLRVTIGNAADVTLRYNDRDFPLEPHTKVSVARFTLE